MTLSGTEYMALTAILTVPMGVVILYLRGIRGDSKTFREEMHRRLATLEDRVLAVEGSRVKHKDWARVVMSQSNRQERMSSQLAELSGKLDATIGIAGGLTRIGDALQRKAEQ